MSLTAADLERALLTRMCDASDVRTIVRDKITGEYFSDGGNRAIFGWLLERYEKFHHVPSVALLQDQFPDFVPVLGTEDDLLLLADALRERKIYADVAGELKKIADAARENPREAVQLLKQAASTLSVSHSTSDEEDATQKAGAVKRQYRLQKKLKGMLGVPWPWAPLNLITRGIRSGQFNAVYGPPGSCKTFLLLHIADHSHEYFNQIPLVVTAEMPVEDIRARYVALRAKVDYELFQDGKLLRADEERFYRVVKELKASPRPFLITQLESTGKAALTEIQAKAEAYGATQIYVDGLSHLVGDFEWKQFGTITLGLKAMARRTRIPILATHHTNRTPSKNKLADNDASDVALGETLFRDTDVLIRIFRSPQNEENDEVELSPKKVREGKRRANGQNRIVLNAKPAYDFSVKYEGDDKDDGILGEDEP